MTGAIRIGKAFEGDDSALNILKWTIDKGTYIISDPWPLTIKQGIEREDVYYSKGNLSKLISFYAQKDNLNSTNSAIGLNINLWKLTANVNLSLEDIGVNASFRGNEYEHLLGIGINFSELKVGATASVSHNRE